MRRSGFVTATEAPPAGRDRPPRLPRILKRAAKVTGIAFVALGLAVTAASFGYNLATNGPPPRPAHLLFARGGGWDTRYLEWGRYGTPVVLVPGAFETAKTFARLGPVLAKNHRVFAIDLSGTGYSAANPPFSARHLADQVLAFVATEHLTGPNAPVLVGHSAGAADVGIAALQDPSAVRGVVFLDGDATPFPFPAFLGTIASTLFINPYRTSVLRLALSHLATPGRGGHQFPRHAVAATSPPAGYRGDERVPKLASEVPDYVHGRLAGRPDHCYACDGYCSRRHCS
jgi:pimeloyl-ACP methyl ester carboxylesterase